MKIQQFIRQIYGKRINIDSMGMLVLAVILAITQFMSARYLGRIIDSVSLGLSSVIFNTTIITISVLTSFIAGCLLFIRMQSMSIKFTNLLHKKMAEKLCKAEYKTLSDINEGELMTTAVDNTGGITGWFNIIVALGQIPIKIVIVFIAIIKIHWVLFLICMVLFPLTLLPSLILSKKMYNLNLDEQKAVGTNINFIKETLNFIIILKSYCLENIFIKKNRDHLDELEVARLKKAKRDRLIQSFSRCIGYIANPILFTIAGYLILRGNMTIGQIISIMFYIDIAGDGINLLTGIGNQYQTVRSCMTRIKSLLDIPDERVTGVALSPVGEEPVFDIRKVSFAYREDRVLREVSIQIMKGDKVAILGKSGSGKTTLFKLLNGLYTPCEGEIFFQGQNISKMSIDDLRKNLSVVPQESFMFSDTIYNNISIAKPGASEEDVIRACRLADIHEFIETLDDGYETVLNNVIDSMSTGQVQRINLARAFLRDADVWLFDEPTSALDAKSRDAIMDYIVNGTGDKTVVCIIHEPELIARFDRQLIIRDGQINSVERDSGRGEMND
ncbi:ABC transporter ATP-binding protein [Bianquea renquensis]|jgi:ABC transporter transmembrane region|uniref:ABC transporter ATP-binding protein n=1 Tax=Bianquea renquensis TaxID=2763661 RepID=A0A926I2Y7_9FIRM|nr:ABC transporter ATP-binding protein [Bianquea renquensis]MBC8544983.1 ABC transporter ATP-binding protein [Bianquea renquensis]